MQKKDDPYLETREKEDAFVERIVSQVTEKILMKGYTTAGVVLCGLLFLLSGIWQKIQ